LLVGFDVLARLHLDGNDFSGQRTRHGSRRARGSAAVLGRIDMGRSDGRGPRHAARFVRLGLVENLDEDVVSFAVDGDAEFFHR
jgi:hypothetical protein